MKKITIVLIAILSVFSACTPVTGGEEDGPVGQIELASSSKANIQLPSDGGSGRIRFTSSMNWTIECSEGWVKINPMEGEAGMARVTIYADANDTPQTRTAVVNICSGVTKFPITVTQDSFIPTFELLDTEKEVSSRGGEITVRVRADVDYEFHCEADWISDASTKAPRTREHKFVVEPNTSAEERTAMITFCADQTCKAFTVKQRAAGTEADDWKQDQFVHRSLAMRFTATWCGYCPYMGTAFDSAKSEMAGALELVSLHGSESNYEFSGTSTLANRFRISGFPSGIVDSRASIPNYSSTSVTASAVVAVAQETQQAYPAKTGIALGSTLDGSTLTVDLSLYVREADSYKVTVLLLEDGIVGYQSGGSNNYQHNDVARLALTSISGDTVRISEDNQIWTKTFTADIKSSWKAENLEILVYVEKPYGDQSKVSEVDGAEYRNYGDTYIDNCRVVKVGTEAPLELK